MFLLKIFAILVAVAVFPGCAQMKQKFGPSQQVLEVDELYRNGENFEIVPMRKVFASSCWVETVDEVVVTKEERTVNGKTETRESMKKFPLRKAICPTSPNATAVAGNNYYGPAPLGMAAAGVRMSTPKDVFISTPPGDNAASRGMWEILGK